MQENKNKFNLLDWAIYNKTFVHMVTGEVLNEYEIEKMVNQSIVAGNQEQILLATELGLSVNVTNVVYKNQSYNCTNIKKNSDFNKLYRVDWREFVENSKLSNSAFAFIARIQGNLKFPTNSIVINGKRPSIKKLCEYTKIGKSTMYNILKELEDGDVIIRVFDDGDYTIYFNPYLIATGTLIDVNTFELFKDNMYRK